MADIPRILSVLVPNYSSPTKPLEGHTKLSLPLVPPCDVLGVVDIEAADDDEEDQDQTLSEDEQPDCSQAKSAVNVLAVYNRFLGLVETPAGQAQLALSKEMIGLGQEINQAVQAASQQVDGALTSMESVLQRLFESIVLDDQAFRSGRWTGRPATILSFRADHD